MGCDIAYQLGRNFEEIATGFEAAHIEGSVCNFL